MNEIVFRDFHVTVNGAMGWDVNQAVEGAVDGAVNRAVNRARILDTPHPGLSLYLNEVPQ